MSFRYDESIKKPNEEMEYTPDMIQELVKCKDDPKHFFSNYIKIQHPDKGKVNFDLYPHQERMLDSIHNNRYSIIKTPRQYGKCVYSNTYITVKNKKTGEVKKVTMEEFYNSI